MGILKNIEWTSQNQNTIVYKYPFGINDQVNKGSALTVRESQVAIFVYKGKLADVFLPGFYKLDTDNMPILTRLMSWAYGFETPFKADIYFVNTKQFTNQKWGTSNPIIVRDNDYGAVRIRAFGTYSFKIDDAYEFMNNISGTCSSFSTEEISSYLRSMIVGGISDTIGESKISILDLAGNMQELAKIVQDKVSVDFKEIGLKFSKFNFESFSLPAELEKALDENSALSMYRKNMDVYQAKGQTDALKSAAQNPGSVGGFMGVGIGMGLGGQMGQQFAKQAQIKDVCPVCKAPVDASSKFCGQCGAKLKPVCPKCNIEYPAGTKFCGQCGTKLD